MALYLGKDLIAGGGSGGGSSGGRKLYRHDLALAGEYTDGEYTYSLIAPLSTFTSSNETLSKSFAITALEKSGIHVTIVEAKEGTTNFTLGIVGGVDESAITFLLMGGLEPFVAFPIENISLAEDIVTEV